MVQATAGYKAKIYVTGADLATSGEGMSDTGDGITYQITDGAKDVWYWGDAVTVYEDGTPTTQDVEIKYLSGRVVFESPPTGPVTVDVSYLPKYKFALGRDVEFNPSYDTHETSVFDHDHVKRIVGLRDVEGSIETLQAFRSDIGSGETSLSEIMADGEHIVLVYNPDGGSWGYRSVIQFTDQTLSQSVDDLQTGSADFVGAAPKSSEGQQVVYEETN